MAGLRRDYRAFNAALGSLYGITGTNGLLQLESAAGKPEFDDTAFFDAAGMVYHAGGFGAAQLDTPQARRLLAETLKHLRTAIGTGLPHEVPATVQHALENNAFIFSGFKTYHTLREVGLSLLTDGGDIKPFEAFRKDVEAVNNRYNHNYLNAEYNHAVGASLMAARWQQIEADGDRYDLQYRTAQDDRVREDHAILHGTTLPPSDPFWDRYLPPNGWNCRCTAVQVRKGKYPRTDPAQAMRRGDNCTAAAKQQIFRFNPGKTLQIFPGKHPYYKAPEEVEKVIENVVQHELRRHHARELKKWYANNLPIKQVGKFTAKRFDVLMQNGQHVFVTKTFYNECISHYVEDELYVARLEYARMAHIIIQKATLIRQEPSNDHPDATFYVYQFNEDGKYTIELKVKCNQDGAFLYYMRLYKK